MACLSNLEIWRMSDEELLRALDSGIVIPRPKRISFYTPSFMHYKTTYYHNSPMDFPTISVTGSSCALECKHCGGRVLDTMYPVATPEELYELCMRLEREGALGCLISGGCLSDGSVPIRKFVNAIKKIKRETGLTVLVHTGIIALQTARALKRSGVDSALIDLIGSDETIKDICKLEATVEDYADSLKALHDSGAAYVPHVVVGLHYGKLKGELKALEIISQYTPRALVIIAFMPVHGTEMENIEPPSPLDIARVMATARIMFPQIPLVLGCMRPKGKHRSKTDMLAIKAGADAIAFPTNEAIRYAGRQGYETSFSSLCCSQIYTKIGNSTS